MQNALKTSYPDPQDEIKFEGAGRKKIFKYQRALIVLLLLAVVIALFNYFSNQKKPVVEAKKLLEPTQNVPLKNQPTASSESPASSPAVKVPGPVKSANPVKSPGPLPEKEKIKLAYMSDKKYMALNRYERFPKKGNKTVRPPEPKVRDTVTLGDRPLALAGKGFHLKGLQSRPGAGLHMDFPHRLQKPVEKREVIPEDRLDLQLTQIKSSRSLIFHPLRQSLGTDNRQAHYQGDEKSEKRKPLLLGKIPETKLLLMEGEESTLILRPGTESMDLLSGNEKVNRNNFSRW